ncbi:MAG: response regulator [Bacteroidales bacterium]
MNEPKGKIFIIDDDASVRKSLFRFFTSLGYVVESFSEPDEFLTKQINNEVCCILLDLNLNGKSGLDFQNELNKKQSDIPIIFITGYGNIKTSVKAIKGGAVNFLEKPFSEKDLLQSVSEALEMSHKILSEKDEKNNANYLISTLSPREFEILRYIMSGMLNKQVAFALGITEHTVKLHRQSISKKLKVKSLPEIIQIAEKAGVMAAVKLYN